MKSINKTIIVIGLLVSISPSRADNGATYVFNNKMGLYAYAIGFYDGQSIGGGEGSKFLLSRLVHMRKEIYDTLHRDPNKAPGNSQSASKIDPQEQETQEFIQRVDQDKELATCKEEALLAKMTPFSEQLRQVVLSWYLLGWDDGLKGGLDYFIKEQAPYISIGITPPGIESIKVDELRAVKLAVFHKAKELNVSTADAQETIDALSSTADQKAKTE